MTGMASMKKFVQTPALNRSEAQAIADSVRKPAEAMFGTAFETFVAMEILAQAEESGGTTIYIKVNIGGSDSNFNVPYDSMRKGDFSDPQPLQPNYRHSAEVVLKTDQYAILRIFADGAGGRIIEGVEVLPLVPYSGYSDPEHDAVQRIEKALHLRGKTGYVAPSSILRITPEIKAIADAVLEQAKAMHGRPFYKYEVVDGVRQEVDGTVYFLKVDTGVPPEVAHYCRGNTQCLILRIHKDRQGGLTLKGLLELPNDGGSALPAKIIPEGVGKE